MPPEHNHSKPPPRIENLRGDRIPSTRSCWVCLEPIYVGSIVQTCYMDEPPKAIQVAHARCAHERAILGADFTTGKRFRYPL
jgi:hypothetical protein